MKKVNVKSDVCIGCGACVSIADKYFKFTDEGYSTTVKEDIDKDDEATVEEAASSCPVSAIEITDEQ